MKSRQAVVASANLSARAEQRKTLVRGGGWGKVLFQTQTTSHSNTNSLILARASRTTSNLTFPQNQYAMRK
jgi:hypothetical protein